MFSTPYNNIHFCFTTLVPSAFYSYWSRVFHPPVWWSRVFSRPADLRVAFRRWMSIFDIWLCADRVLVLTLWPAAGPALRRSQTLILGRPCRDLYHVTLRDLVSATCSCYAPSSRRHSTSANGQWSLNWWKYLLLVTGNIISAWCSAVDSCL